MFESNWRPPTQCLVSPVALAPPGVVVPGPVAPLLVPPLTWPPGPVAPGATAPGPLAPGVVPGIVPAGVVPSGVVPYGDWPAARPEAAVGAVEGAARTSTSWTTTNMTIGPNFPSSGLLGTGCLLGTRVRA